MSKNFAVNDVDLSLSEYYDGETDTYLWTEKHYYFAEPQIIDTEVNYKNGAWNVKLTAADETNMYLKLDDNLRVISMTYGCTVGDLDGDEAVTESDAIYLLMYTFFPEDYPIEQPCDFDGDGDITEADANLNGDIFKLTLKAKQASSQEQSVSVSVEYKSGTTVVGSNSSSVKIKAVCKNHTYGEYSKVNDSQHKHVCTVCEYEEKVNHTWNSGSVTKAATCKEEGVKTYTCTACKATKTETIAKTNNHTWGNWNTTKQPTCTTPGTTTKTCSTCGKTENQTINATGHSMGAWSQSKAPTCTASGEEKRSCSKCNHTETRTVKALGHSFSNPTVTKQPTCTETGVETGKCTRCGQTTTNTIKAKGHKFGEWTDTKAATCTEGGVQERKCTVCDTVETRNTEALGHDFENPTIVKEPSISNTGLKEGKCKRCGETTSEIIPCSVKDDTTGTLFEANEGVFTAGTELKVEEIKKDNPTFESAKNILKDVCNEFILYDITAVLNGAKVQPNGEVTVTFNIPDGFGKDVAVFFVSDDGTYEKLESEVNEDGKTITAKLNHFSNYAVCKVSDNKAEISTDKAEPEISTDKTENAKNNNVLYLIIAALAIAVIVGVTVFIMKKKKQI